jgi:hypothetical protein
LGVILHEISSLTFLDVEKNVATILRCHSSVKGDVERFCKLINQRMEEELKKKLAILLQRKDRLYQYTQEVSGELSKVDHKLRCNEKVGLILCSAKLAASFSKVGSSPHRRRSLYSFCIKQTKISVGSRFQPSLQGALAIKPLNTTENTTCARVMYALHIL